MDSEGEVDLVRKVIKNWMLSLKCSEDFQVEGTSRQTHAAEAGGGSRPAVFMWEIATNRRSYNRESG